MYRFCSFSPLSLDDPHRTWPRPSAVATQATVIYPTVAPSVSCPRIFEVDFFGRSPDSPPTHPSYCPTGNLIKPNVRPRMTCFSGSWPSALFTNTSRPVQDRYRIENIFHKGIQNISILLRINQLAMIALSMSFTAKSINYNYVNVNRVINMYFMNTIQIYKKRFFSIILKSKFFTTCRKSHNRAILPISSNTF